eukprot:2274732-Amphidinium_carterae.1
MSIELGRSSSSLVQRTASHVWCCRRLDTTSWTAAWQSIKMKASSNEYIPALVRRFLQQVGRFSMGAVLLLKAFAAPGYRKSLTLHWFTI